MGFMKGNLVKLGDEKIIICQKDMNLVNEFRKIFGYNPSIEFKYFLAMFIKSYLEIIYQKKFKYELEYSNQKNFYIFIKTDENFIYESDKVYDKCDVSAPSTSWINTLVINKNLININGRIILNDVISFGLPIMLYFNFVDEILKYKLDDFKELLKSFGFNFSKVLEFKGFKTPIQKFDYISSYWNLMGLGDLTRLREDCTSFLVKTNFHSYFSNFYSEDFYVGFRQVQYLDMLGTFEYSFDVKADIYISNDLTNIKFNVISKSGSVLEKKHDISNLITSKKGSFL